MKKAYKKNYLINYFPFLLNIYFTESSKPHRSLFGWRGARSSSLSPGSNMATSSSGVLKDLSHPNYNEALKTHNGVTFKLVKTGEYTN